MSVSRETIHRIRLSRMGTTFVDVGFYPDRERGTTNGTLSIHGDFGPFEYAWGSTGRQYFYEFLAGMRYDYAMTKLCKHGEAYKEDWSTLPAKLKANVVELRKGRDLTALEARTLFDYFNNDVLTDEFSPQSYEEYRMAMEQDIMTNLGRKDRRNMEWMQEEDYHDEDPIPVQVMYGGYLEDIPTPELVRSEPYFWDEVWPVIVEEIRNLEEELNHD